MVTKLPVNPAPDAVLKGKWNHFRRIYEDLTPRILETAESHGVRKWMYAYSYDWISHFSDAEDACWCSIRSKKVVLYPQYPLMNYLLDFGNPFLKIGLEIDGKDYHDTESDKERDERCWAKGWRIFRVPAALCYTPYKSFYDTHRRDLTEADMNNWFLNSLDGVVEAIQIVYFTEPSEFCESEDDEDSEVLDLAYKTLKKHRLVDFRLTDG